MANTRTRFKTVASLTIKGADKMTPRQRREVAVWLRWHATHIVKHGREYDSTLRGRYFTDRAG